jgi:hypothetical protein
MKRQKYIDPEHLIIWNTKNLWRDKAGVELTHDQAKQAIKSVSEYFGLLDQWDTEQRKT